MNRITPAELADELKKVSDTLQVAVHGNSISTLDRELVLERLRHIYDAFHSLDFTAPAADRTDVLSAYLGDETKEHSNAQLIEEKDVPKVISIIDEHTEEPFLVHTSIDREVIESLYGSAEPEPEEEDEPIEQPELLPPPMSRLRRSIGLNDRIMLLADLFEGDEALYEKTIGVLERADTIDDAYIYLYEHFTLDDDKEGVKRLIALLEANFS